MGLNAALNAAEIVTLLQQALATQLIALSNAAAFRRDRVFSNRGGELLKMIRETSPILDQDRRFDRDIEKLTEKINQGQLNL